MAHKYLISVVGPTAIGKTSLAITLAKHYETEIVSADSRQFFKEMQIGTAVPNKEELATIPHHFIHHKSIFESYSVGDFEKEAIALLSNLFKKHDYVIMVGGSGLYVDAITKGLDEFPEVDPGVREDLNKKLNENGIVGLQNQLKLLDETHFAKIDIENPHRLIRALEVCIGSGKPYSSFLNKKKTKRPFKTITIGLKADRHIIYDRIDQRVDIMIKEGLLKEARTLYPHRALNALQTVGYKELFNYFNGEWDLDFAISEIKKNTRRFAKRQLTWYRKNENLIWFDYDEDKANIFKTIDKEIKAYKMNESLIYIVMGVSGCGKSTIGKLLATKLKIPFFDGDDFHPEANVQKMASGLPLNDKDRKGWLQKLNEIANEHKPSGAVIACSALKATYRSQLQLNLEKQMVFVYLKGTFEEIHTRLKERRGHYMPIELLKSQFETLEVPENAIHVSINHSPEEIVSDILDETQ